MKNFESLPQKYLDMVPPEAAHRNSKNQKQHRTTNFANAFFFGLTLTENQ